KCFGDNDYRLFDGWFWRNADGMPATDLIPRYIGGSRRKTGDSPLYFWWLPYCPSSPQIPSCGSPVL
ncbi:hypothetical protein HAX54_019352, partial [Datura stramonium]|nr:hypothetical protein [Datura stramonium]